MTTTSAVRPGKRASASAAPNGMPTTAAHATAVSVTRNDSRMMPMNAGSP